MFDKNKFKYSIMVKGKNLREVASVLNISSVTLWRKMNGGSEFSREEIQTIKNMLNLTQNEAFEIFFAE